MNQSPHSAVALAGALGSFSPIMSLPKSSQWWSSNTQQWKSESIQASAQLCRSNDSIIALGSLLGAGGGFDIASSGKEGRKLSSWPETNATSAAIKASEIVLDMRKIRNEAILNEKRRKVKDSGSNELGNCIPLSMQAAPPIQKEAKTSTQNGAFLGNWLERLLSRLTPAYYNQAIRCTAKPNMSCRLRLRSVVLVPKR